MHAEVCFFSLAGTYLDSSFNLSLLIARPSCRREPSCVTFYEYESLLCPTLVPEWTPLLTSIAFVLALENITKLALAIDYHGNGYRKFARMALHDPAILNALLAVACSHLSKWRRKQDTESRVYLRKAVSMLQQRFRTPKLVRNEATVVIMLLLSTYEVGTSFCPHTLTRFLRTRLCLTRSSTARTNGGITTMPFQAGYGHSERRLTSTPSSKRGSLSWKHSPD